jgi:hypothetical protein
MKEERGKSRREVGEEARRRGEEEEEEEEEETRRHHLSSPRQCPRKRSPNLGVNKFRSDA